MPYATGERFACDECGAEIVFTKPCNCPEDTPKTHSNLCCGKEMRSAGVEKSAAPQPPPAP